jgi:hypothetical protein
MPTKYQTCIKRCPLVTEHAWRQAVAQETVAHGAVTRPFVALKVKEAKILQLRAGEQITCQTDTPRANTRLWRKGCRRNGVPANGKARRSIEAPSHRPMKVARG